MMWRAISARPLKVSRVEQPVWRPGGMVTSSAPSPSRSDTGGQGRLAEQLEDAKDELYAIYDVVEERTARVAEAEAERRRVMLEYRQGWN